MIHSVESTRIEQQLVRCKSLWDQREQQRTLDKELQDIQEKATQTSVDKQKLLEKQRQEGLRQSVRSVNRHKESSRWSLKRSVVWHYRYRPSVLQKFHGKKDAGLELRSPWCACVASTCESCGGR